MSDDLKIEARTFTSALFELFDEFGKGENVDVAEMISSMEMLKHQLLTHLSQTGK